MDVTEVAADLVAEQDALDTIVAKLTPEQWRASTASPRWNVVDQVAHLTYFDHAAALAINSPDAFKASIRDLFTAGQKGEEGMDAFTLDAYRTLSPQGLLAAWRDGRSALAGAAARLENDTRVEWYGPSMGAKSFLTARLMEAWAHGQDILDTVGATREATDRLAHIARLGFITRGWTYMNRKEETPANNVYVVLDAPSGATWKFGTAKASDQIRGSAEDFCLVVTQRRHLDNTELVVSGAGARDWLLKAQAFAGPPTDGPSSN